MSSHNADGVGSHLFDSSRSAMSLTTAAKVEVLSVLVRAGREARAPLTPHDCNTVVETSAHLAEIAPTLPEETPGDRARATRSAMELFLSVDCPQLAPELREELARAVEHVVVRHPATAV